MYYEMLTDSDELLHGAALHFENVPVPAVCANCGEEFPTEAREPVCPMCGSLLVRHDPAAAMIQLTDLDIDEGSAGAADEAPQQGATPS